MSLACNAGSPVPIAAADPASNVATADQALLTLEKMKLAWEMADVESAVEVRIGGRADVMERRLERFQMAYQVINQILASESGNSPQ